MLVVLLVLFVPFRYRIRGRYHEQIKAKVSVSWLLKMIHVKAEAIQAQIRVRICLFGFVLKKMYLGNWGDEAPGGEADLKDTEKTTGPAKEVKPQSAEESKKKAEKPPKEAAGSRPSEPTGTEESGKAAAPKDKYDLLFEKLEKKAAEKQALLDQQTKGKEKKEAEPPAADESLSEEEKSFLTTALEWSEKISDFWDDEKNQFAVGLIEKKLLGIGKHLLPTTFLIDGELGLSDPAKTGEIIGKLYRFYPLYGDHIRVRGIYDEERTNIYAEIGGRIRLAVFVGAALRLLANKRIRSWLKMLLKKDKTKDTGKDGPVRTGSGSHTSEKSSVNAA